LLTWERAVFSGSRRAYVYPVAGLAHAVASIMEGCRQATAGSCFGYWLRRTPFARIRRLGRARHARSYPTPNPAARMGCQSETPGSTLVAFKW